MTDISPFLDEDFDVKAYVNAATAAVGPDEAVDRQLAELEMRLHLAAEDVALQLQDQATRATQRIPGAVRELLRIKEDASSVRASTEATLDQLEQDDRVGGAATAVAALEELDVVKQRMEEACSTLKEAAGLSTLFSLVDDLFASGDLQRVADALAGMRRGLAVVGNTVPEFSNGYQRLAQLEERFTSAAEAPLTAALAKQKGEEAASLAGMLTSLGREAQVERLYTAARSPPLQSLWDSYAAGTPFVPWLSTFYDQLVRSAAAECEWCAPALPSNYPRLVLALLTSFLSAVDKPHRARLAGALTGAAGSNLPLETLEQAQAAAQDFVEALHAALTAAGALGGDGEENAAFGALYSRAVAPLEGALQQYPDKEQQYLTADIQAITARASREGAASHEALAPALTTTVEPVFSATDAALARCIKLTEGTSLPGVARVLDRAVQQYIAAVQAAVAALRGKVAFSQGAGGPEQAEAVLPLLLVSSSLEQHVARLEVAVAAAAAATVPALLAVAAGGAGEATEGRHLPSMAALRLHAQPALQQQLAAFQAAAGSPLPVAHAATAELALFIGGFAEDVLCARLRSQLAAVPSLPEWTAQPSAGVALPTFTPYPLQYVTSAGEYLMMLPQLLESALTAEEGEDDEEAGRLVAEWIDRAAGAAAAAYLQQLSLIQRLSPLGAAQLAADLEYFTNVLSTLGSAVPPALAAWQAAAAAPDAEALQAVAEAAGEGGGEAACEAVEGVAKLRGLALQVSPPPPQE